MTIQYSVALRNARLAADETAIGTTPHLKLFTGSMPANAAAASTGTELMDMVLPSDWQDTPASGAAAKLGTWQENAAANGKAGYWRMFETTETTCHMQGLTAMPWAASSPFAVGDQVDNGGNVYICTTAGTTAASGGPTGTGTGIVDGSAVWDYLGTTTMVLQNVNIAAPQPITISTFTRTAGGA